MEHAFLEGRTLCKQFVSEAHFPCVWKHPDGNVLQSSLPRVHDAVL